MKKFLLAVGLLFCCASVSHAQVEYPDVPFEDSAYADINSLSQKGVFDGCYGSTEPRAMTRYEFAVAIARLLERINNVETTQIPFSYSEKLKNDPNFFVALKRLVNKFLPELKALGFDAKNIKINGELLIEPQVAPIEWDSPTVLLGDSAYKDIDFLSRHGIFEGSDGIYDKHGLTRNGFAIAMARFLDSHGVESNGTKPSKNLTFTNKDPNVLAALKQLSEKFLPELEAFGFQAQQIKKFFLPKPNINLAITQVAPAFSDVPKNHWAFESVEKLRLSGIMIGVPDEK